MTGSRYPVKRDTADLLSHPDQGLSEQERQAEIRDVQADGSAGGGDTSGLGVTRFRTSDQTQAGGARTNSFNVAWESDYENTGADVVTSAIGTLVTATGWYIVTAYAQLNIPDPGVDVIGYLSVTLESDVNQHIVAWGWSPMTILTGTTLYGVVTVTSEPFHVQGDPANSWFAVEAGATAKSGTLGTLSVLGQAARSDGSPDVGSARIAIRSV